MEIPTLSAPISYTDQIRKSPQTLCWHSRSIYNTGNRVTVDYGKYYEECERPRFTLFTLPVYARSKYEYTNSHRYQSRYMRLSALENRRPTQQEATLDFNGQRGTKCHSDYSHAKQTAATITNCAPTDTGSEISGIGSTQHAEK